MSIRKYLSRYENFQKKEILEELKYKNLISNLAYKKKKKNKF